MEFVSAIQYRQEDYLSAGNFLCEHFGFVLLKQDAVSITVNNGVLSVRISSASYLSDLLHLDLESGEFQATISTFKSLGFIPVDEVHQPTTFRVEQTLKGSFGLTVTVYQILTEDDLDIPTDLKNTLDWDEDAKKMAQTLLKHVSLHFREVARKKMVAQAEGLAMIEGEITVNMSDMVAAFLYTTPNFKQSDLRGLLSQNGFSEDYIEKQLQRFY